MSDFRIEPLEDHAWGFRATLRLLWHHRWVLSALALVAFLAQFPAYLLDKWILREVVLNHTNWDFARRLLPVNLIIGQIISVGVSVLFLKSAGVTSSWPVRVLATLILILVALVAFGMEAGFNFFTDEQDDQNMRYLVTAIYGAFTISYVTVCFCLCAQILVDGKPSFRQAYKGVRRRWVRLWLFVGLGFVLALPSWGANTLLPDTKEPGIMMYLSIAILSVLKMFDYLVSMAGTALATIWFLYPRGQLMEEKATSEVANHSGM